MPCTVCLLTKGELSPKLNEATTALRQDFVWTDLRNNPWVLPAEVSTTLDYNTKVFRDEQSRCSVFWSSHKFWSVSITCSCSEKSSPQKCFESFVDLLCCENENWNMLRLENLVLRSSTLRTSAQLSSFQDFAKTNFSKKLRYESTFVLISRFRFENVNKQRKVDFKFHLNVSKSDWVDLEIAWDSCFIGKWNHNFWMRSNFCQRHIRFGFVVSFKTNSRPNVCLVLHAKKN